MWSNRSAVDRLHIDVRNIRRRAVLDVDAIATQKQDGTTQSLGLTFHQQDKVRQNLAQWRVLRDQFEHSTLPGSKEFLFFRFGDIPADNDTAYDFAIG